MTLLIIVRSFLMVGLLSLLSALPLSSALAEKITDGRPELTLPIDCQIGKECYVQNFVDIDPGKGVLDPSCGKASYNGHKGTDFAILSMKQMANGVRVIAALPGRVIGVRNRMADQLIKTPQQYKALPKNRYCGNGIVVQHENGWQTQYCHLRRGSIRLKKGVLLKRGETIGLVGLSGMTTFPHVHLSVRHNKKVIDPFTGETPQRHCGQAGYFAQNSASLWRKDVQKLFPAQNSFMLRGGFSDHAVSRRELRLNPPKPPTSESAPALLLYASISNMKKGDKLHFLIKDSAGKTILSQPGKSLTRHKARYMGFAGKRRPRQGWTPGEYIGEISLLRSGQAVLQKTFKVMLD